MSAAKFTSQAKTIYVMRIIGRVEGRHKNVYRLEVVKTLKGERVEQMTFDLKPPEVAFPKKFPRSKFAFAKGNDCQPRGNLIVDQLYIFYPGDLKNKTAILPVTSMADPLIDQIESYIHKE